jgi:hypothetical protein
VADETPPSATEGRADADQVSDGGSLFDVAGTSPESEDSTTQPGASPEVEAKAPEEKKPEPKKDVDLDEGGSLFDL